MVPLAHILLNRNGRKLIYPSLRIWFRGFQWLKLTKSCRPEKDLAKKVFSDDRQPMTSNYKYIFGPVPSRRFGRSLGVDLTPYKTCSLDCVFWQLGRTKKKTVTRKEYVPTGAVLAEIKDWLKSNGDADYITLSGSGEPTLHAGFGNVLEYLKTCDIPSAVLTNGTMLYLSEVREAALDADIVKVSLSVWNQNSFEWVNRPHSKLMFNRLVTGIKDFRSRFRGELWLEVFLLLGINSMPADVEKIAALAGEIKPDRIHLNTVVRPPAEDFAKAVPKDRMKALTHLFEPPAEIMSDSDINGKMKIQVNEDTILAMLQRRPCTMKQIEQTFGMHINEASKYLGKLMRSNRIRVYTKNAVVYYQAVIHENSGNIRE